MYLVIGVGLGPNFVLWKTIMSNNKSSLALQFKNYSNLVCLNLNIRGTDKHKASKASKIE